MSPTQVGKSKLYVFGGESSERLLLDDVHVLDLASMAWAPSAPLKKKGAPWPEPRAKHSATCIADRYLLVRTKQGGYKAGWISCW
jgi:hypothetical protein